MSMSPETRIASLAMLQDTYRSFRPFLEDGMRFLGFSLSEMQADIGSFLEYGPQHLMVQAQREEAKSTIVTLFVVWSLIHDPTLRILICSAGEDTANQMSTGIIQIIQRWEILECLRPDRSKGDRVSTEAFDVHYLLKGVNKSPSIKCYGIFGGATGSRADILIADDVESPKNSETPKMREKLMERTREFSSICGTGRIIYLGTPQNNDSIYNSLPGRGYTVRIWPGRYPTPTQLPTYGENLAPYILNKIKADPSVQTGGGPMGDQGQPTDPLLKDEETLRFKELSEGTAHFQLQFMLNTALKDKTRYPLKTHNLIYMNLAHKQDPNEDLYPMTVIRDPRDDAVAPIQVAGHTYKFGRPAFTETGYSKLQSRIMFVDPASGGTSSGDEIGYAVVGFLNGNIFIIEAGGIPGGTSEATLDELGKIAERWKPQRILFEKNFGNGMFTKIAQPIIYKRYQCAIEDVNSTGQKEVRIIDTIEPVMGRGSLVVLQNAIKSNEETLMAHEAASRRLYCLFYQMNYLTRHKDALEHDDRVDALSGAIKHFERELAIDQQKKIEEANRQAFLAWQADPTGSKAIKAMSVGIASPRKGSMLMNRLTRKR